MYAYSCEPVHCAVATDKKSAALFHMPAFFCLLLILNNGLGCNPECVVVRVDKVKQHTFQTSTSAPFFLASFCCD